MKRTIVLLVVLVALSLPASELPVKEVVVFKNGIGFLTRTGEVEFRDGKASIGLFPPATYGGMWVASGRGGPTIEEAVSLTKSDSIRRPATSVPELLDANDGRKVTLVLSDRALSGKLRSRPDSSFALVEADGATTALMKSEVRSLTASDRLVTERHVEESTPVLELRSGKTSGRYPVTIASLERGIGWTPEYEVRLDEDGRAVVSLRAVLINDAADLEDAEVSFAVGYPSFAFAEIRTPLDPRQSLAQFLQSLTLGSRRGTPGPMANVMSQAVSVSGLSASDAIDLPDSLTAGERQQDLYLYRKTGVNLRSGERGSYSLMRASVPFSHTWDWTIEDHSRVSVYGYEESRMRDEIRDQVWHSVRLENGAEAPWTTGPALVVDGGRPIAQNTLHYTPAGAATRLRLTVATDIIGDHSEIEKARVPQPMRKFGTTYEGLDFEGTLTITNHRRDRVTVDAARTLTGSVIAAGEGGSAVRLAEEPSAVNPRSKIDWSISVGPGETKSVTYLFRVWVRR